MTRKRITLLSVLAAMILMISLFMSFLGADIFGGADKPIVLPSPVDLSSPGSGEPYDFPTAPPKQVLPVSVTPDSVQRVISTLVRPKSYFYRLDINLYWTGGQSSLQRRIYMHDGYSHIDFLSSAGKVEKSAVSGGGKIFYWTPGSAQFYKGAAGEATADDIQSIPTYEDILVLDKAAITSASYTQYEDQDCIYVSTHDKALDCTDHYWVNLHSGLLVTFERYQGDTLVCRASMTLLDLSEPSDEKFRLPNRTLAWDMG